VAFVTILSKFAPILLSNIPFRNVHTWPTHLACASASLVILFMMMVVLVWSFWDGMKSPEVDVPAELDTLVGLMYLVCDSPVLEEFEGMAAVDGKRWRQKVREVARYGDRDVYRIGEMKGISGRRRVGVYRGPESWAPG